jgi:hypothetical protein
MEINRNQWFLVGVVLLLLGIQFRFVDSFVLVPEFARFLADGSGNRAAAADTTSGGATSPLLKPFQNAPAKKTLTPPEWLGWAMLSVGLVLTLQSLAMKRPE